MNRSESFSDELLSGYLDGELTADEQAQVEQWLASSADHRLLVDELRAVRASFESLPCYQLDADFSQRVMRRAEREMLSRPSPASSSRESADLPAARSRSPLLWRSVLALGASLAAVMAFVFLSPMFKGNQNTENSVVSTDQPAPSDESVDSRVREFATVPDQALASGGEPEVDEGAREEALPILGIASREEYSVHALARDLMQITMDGDDEVVVAATADPDALSQLLERFDISFVIDNGESDSPVINRARAMKVAITAPDAWRENSQQTQGASSAGAGASFQDAPPKSTAPSELIVIESTLDKVAMVMDRLAQASDEFTWAVVHQNRRGAAQLNLQGVAARQLYQDADEREPEIHALAVSPAEQRGSFRSAQEGEGDVQDALESPTVTAFFVIRSAALADTP